MQSNEMPTEIQQLKEWLASEKVKLSALGVSKIIGEYSGSGDEGQFDGAFALGKDDLWINYQLPHNIVKLLEEATDILAWPGYQDGDGGGGSITLNVETGTIIHESYDLSVERYEHPEVAY